MSALRHLCDLATNHRDRLAEAVRLDCQSTVELEQWQLNLYKEVRGAEQVNRVARAINGRQQTAECQPTSGRQLPQTETESLLAPFVPEFKQALDQAKCEVELAGLALSVFAKLDRLGEAQGLLYEAAAECSENRDPQLLAGPWVELHCSLLNELAAVSPMTNGKVKPPEDADGADGKTDTLQKIPKNLNAVRLAKELQKPANRGLSQKEIATTFCSENEISDVKPESLLRKIRQSGLHKKA